MIGNQFTESLTTKSSLAERIAFVHQIPKEFFNCFIADDGGTHG